MMQVGKRMKPKDIKIAELQIICNELKNTTETLFNTKAQLLAEISQLKADNQRINDKSLNIAEIKRLGAIIHQLKAENATLKTSYGVSLPEYNRLKLAHSELQSANTKLRNELLQRDGTIRELNRKVNNARNLLTEI
jgi:chromosome segregation ATPase